MYDKVRVYPYNIKSKSASILCEGLRERGTRCFKIPENKKYIPKRSNLIINWGCSRPPIWGDLPNREYIDILNHWEYVKIACDKLKTFTRLKEMGIRVPEFTTNIEEAQDWYLNGDKVIGRGLLQSHSGRGIYITHRDMDVINMSKKNIKLYVKYIKKINEYRVHVFNGEVIDIQQKKRKWSVPDEKVNYKIRSYNNGWIFSRKEISIPSSIFDIAINAVNCLNLNFGAVDIVYDSKGNIPYILEINTAPGLVGTTINIYINKMMEIIENYGI